MLYAEELVGQNVHPIVTNESVSEWLGITRYQAHILMHAIDEAYIVHGKEFTMSIFDMANALLHGKGVTEGESQDGTKFTYISLGSSGRARDSVTLIFSWKDHTFYISSISDFIRASLD